MPSWFQEKSKLFSSISEKICAVHRWNSAFSQKKLALKQHFSALIFLLWNIDISVLITAESAMFRDFQLIYRAESELKQRWLARMTSESEVISVEIF